MNLCGYALTLKMNDLFDCLPNIDYLSELFLYTVDLTFVCKRKLLKVCQVN